MMWCYFLNSPSFNPSDFQRSCLLIVPTKRWCRRGNHVYGIHGCPSRVVLLIVLSNQLGHRHISPISLSRYVSRLYYFIRRKPSWDNCYVGHHQVMKKVLRSLFNKNPGLLRQYGVYTGLLQYIRCTMVVFCTFPPIERWRYTLCFEAMGSFVLLVFHSTGIFSENRQAAEIVPPCT